MADLPAGDDEATGLERLALLASALSGRAVHVAAAEPGEPAWTDGSTVFLNSSLDSRARLQSLAVQASLLAAGSLQADVMRKLARRPSTTKRYLTVEGHRALAENDDLLPSGLRPLVDCTTAAPSDSAAASLAIALSRQAIADPPRDFGTIRARKLLAAQERAASTLTRASEHAPRRQREFAVPELDEDENNGASAGSDLFTSPVGGGGCLGRLLRQMLGAVRHLGEGGMPGADAPTHRFRSGVTGGGNAVVSRAEPSEPQEQTPGDANTFTYPEWDVQRRRYRPDWCTVREVAVRPKDDAALDLSDTYGLRRPLARLGVGLDHCRRQAQGHDIDIDAAVEARVEVMAGSAPDEAVYLDSLRCRRDLSVLLLLDVSGSAAEPGARGQTVHQQQVTAAAALTAALHDLGDRVSLYAFHSQGRSCVELMPVKRFDDDVDALFMRRLHALVPGAYSRLGAAIRHGASVLERKGGTPRRLLVVLSDGLAYDHGYERVYGAADARRALSEARLRGTGCLCLTIGASTDADDLRRVFGSAAHATIPRLEQLGRVIGPLFRAALQSAEVRRRVPTRQRGNDG